MVEILHKRNAQIIEAYTAALDGRDNRTVSIRELLPRIFKAVPGVTPPEILEALEWSARQCSREIDALDAKLKALG